MHDFYSVYTLLECSDSKKSINLLEEKAKPFLVIIMDKHPIFFNTIKSDTKLDKTPIIIQQLRNSTINIIGGFAELEKHLQERQDG